MIGRYPSRRYPPRVAALTAGVGGIPNPVPDGFEVDYVADATNGILWHLRYNLGSASAYKWEFVGGSALYAAIDTDQSLTSSTYVDLATVGPSLTLPLVGDYYAHYGTQFFSPGAAQSGLMTIAINGVTSDVDAVQCTQAAAFHVQSAARIRKLVGAPAATTLVCKYRTTGGVASDFQHRWMNALPVRVG